VSPDLAGKDLLKAVVVCDGGHRGRLGMQGNGRERPSFAVEASHQFGCQMLGFSCRPAVTGNEQPVPEQKAPG
jgi:hypothetical protein